MNRGTLGTWSSVMAVLWDPGPVHFFVLRCFLCDWGMTVSSHKDALDSGIEHESEHGLAVRNRQTARRGSAS